MIERYWSRKCGEFVDNETGKPLLGSWNGSVREWYERLVEEMLHLANNAVFINNGPITSCYWSADSSIKTILEDTVMYRPLAHKKPNLGTIGADWPGEINNVPVYAHKALDGSRTIELRNDFYNVKGSFDTRILGKIQVIGFD